MPRRLAILALLCALLAAAAPMRADPAREPDKLQQFMRPEDVPFPAKDPYSDAKANLGRMLFFDPILSASGTRSCASCHNPGLSWTDGLPRALGEHPNPAIRHTPSLLDVAWIPLFGWDGRFPDLESVAFEGPITGQAMMDRKEPELIAALQAIQGYRRAFRAAFPDGAISRPHIEEALATFERTIIAGEAPFDRWIDGDANAIDDAAKRGFALFTGKAGCAQCHSGWNFTDGAFYDIGAGSGEDIGRGRIFPNSPKLRYGFKVPTLRDVARRAPYMHDGSEPTLAAVIDLYDRGGVERPSRSELIKPLGLTKAEKRDLIAFLATLTGDAAPFPAPSLPR